MKSEKEVIVYDDYNSKIYGGENPSEQSRETSDVLLQETESRSSRFIDYQAVKRIRTDQERRRRHLHGDKGATFSRGKTIALGNDDIMNALTTVISKDNLISEILWI